MSMNGGYKIVDFQDKNITSDAGITLVGIYESVESTRKAILVSGLTLDGVEQRDVFVNPVNGENNFTFSAYGRTFTVTSEDAITVSAAG